MVRNLSVAHVGPDSREGLRPLLAFADLRELELEHVTGVDLSPLTELGIERLTLQYARDLELEPLGRLGAVRELGLFNLDDCRSPERLILPASVRTLAIGNDGAGCTGRSVKALIEAIDWSGLHELRSLGLWVGGRESLPPIEVDLGFLRHLTRLERLDLAWGVWHSGRSRSPLEPPFDGLARTLGRLRIDAWEPAPLEASLRAYLGHEVSVLQRYGPEPHHRLWSITPLEGGWISYGSLWEASEGRDGDTEPEALKAARARLRAVDPALLRRLDFDEESSGTSITAPTRGDLESTFRILGIDQPPSDE